MAHTGTWEKSYMRLMRLWKLITSWHGWLSLKLWCMTVYDSSNWLNPVRLNLDCIKVWNCICYVFFFLTEVIDICYVLDPISMESVPCFMGTSLPGTWDGIGCFLCMLQRKHTLVPGTYAGYLTRRQDPHTVGPTSLWVTRPAYMPGRIYKIH